MGKRSREEERVGEKEIKIDRNKNRFSDSERDRGIKV